MSDVDIVKGKESQKRAAKAKVYASFAEMTGKPKAFDEFSAVLTPGGDPRWYRFEAMGSTDYSDLLTKHQPTTEQRAQGLNYNPRTFAPALLAEVCVMPKGDASQWKVLLDADNWSGGEGNTFYDRAIGLCMKGLDPGPTEAG